MRIAVIGGGPGGLYFAALAKQLDPRRDITVWERNSPDDTFGFGVVFSDETLGGIEHADEVIYQRMRAEFAQWDDIDIHYAGQVITSGGHGFAAMGRVRLLRILRERCLELGVRVRHHTEAPDLGELTNTHDLVVAADGVHSATRAKHADVFRPTYETRRCKYVWLGTDKVFDAFTFAIRDTPYGVMQVHAYPYDKTGSTLIVEMHDEVWRRAGFDAEASEPPAVAPLGPAAETVPDGTLDRCGEIFADLLRSGDGSSHTLISNNSKWINFVTVRCETWRHGNLVLLGDAAHTAHFSIGSGTKLAMEDALALAACLAEQPTLDEALIAYETERRPVVLSTQRAAQASLE
ncbi:MAG: FAD-dependent monooxygenase, partial [Micromonosporaceae bacterium]